MHVALVNSNQIVPPIAPIGLDYVAEALNAAGHRVEVLDLCWEDDACSGVTRFFDGSSFGLVGVTLRGSDLRYANLSKADLSYANLSGADIDGADFSGAVLDRAIWIDQRPCAPGSIGVCRRYRVK